MGPSKNTMATSANGRQDLAQSQDLLKTVRSTRSLIQNFLQNLKAGTAASSTSNTKDAPEPLDVLHTSATLLKAHTTKLSLLIINKPFTPSAIRKVISEVSGTCVPAMMSAVEICQPDTYTKILHEEVKSIVRTVFRELEQIMGRLESFIDDTGASGGGSRDSLVSTGVLWGACDELVELKREGLPGLLVRKARLFKETLEDGINELREWGTKDENEEDEDEDDNESLDSVERMFAESDKIPEDRPDLRETLDMSLTRLKLVKSVYDSIIRHRLKNMKGRPDATDESTPSPVQRLDQTIDLLRQLPDEVGELAASLYEHNDADARESLGEVCDGARKAVEIMRTGWLGEQDEFFQVCRCLAEADGPVRMKAKHEKQHRHNLQ